MFMLNKISKYITFKIEKYCEISTGLLTALATKYTCLC